MKGTIRSIRVVGLLLGVVAVLASSIPARAQEVVHSAFVLPFDVQWQGKTLPAGEYHFTASSAPFDQPNLSIRDAQGRPKMVAQPVLFETAGEPSGQSALTIVNRNGKRYVRSLQLGPMGTTRVYPVPNKKKADERELETSTRVIPVQNARTGR